MDGDAVQRIRKLAEKAAGSRTVVEIDGRQYSTVSLQAQKPPQPDALEVHNLSGLVDYVAANRDGLELGGCVLHVLDERTVELLGPLQEAFQQRPTYVRATCRDRLSAARFSFGTFQPTEQVVIALQALFADREHRAAALELIGNVKDEALRTQEDDGVTQEVTARSGVSVVETREVENPYTLAPFRTFTEIDQPASPFVLRLQKDERQGITAALFESDGGAWKDEAISRIAGYLGEELEEPAIIA